MPTFSCSAARCRPCFAEADKLRVAGKPTEAQAKYESASKGKGVDIPDYHSVAIAMKEFNTVQQKLTALGDPPSIRKKHNALLWNCNSANNRLQLEQIIQVGKEVKTEYADLNEQGKPGEALPSDQRCFEHHLNCSPVIPAYRANGKAQSLGSITSDAEKHAFCTNKQWQPKIGLQPSANCALKAASTRLRTINQGAKDRLGAMDRTAEIQTELGRSVKNTPWMMQQKHCVSNNWKQKKVTMHYASD